MSREIESVNTVSTGYELYVPIGVKQLIDSDYNQKFMINDTYVYLYVDTVSYYHKYRLNYETDGKYNYYYKTILLNDKIGYIGINKQDDDSYFVENNIIFIRNKKKNYNIKQIYLIIYT